MLSRPTERESEICSEEAVFQKEQKAQSENDLNYIFAFGLETPRSRNPGSVQRKQRTE